MTFNQFCNYVNTIRFVKGKHLRLGQSAMVLLNKRYPNIYKNIAGTEFDPFYNDDKIKPFLKHLLDNYVELKIKEEVF